MILAGEIVDKLVETWLFGQVDDDVIVTVICLVPGKHVGQGIDADHGRRLEGYVVASKGSEVGWHGLQGRVFAFLNGAVEGIGVVGMGEKAVDDEVRSVDAGLGELCESAVHFVQARRLGPCYENESGDIGVREGLDCSSVGVFALVQTRHRAQAGGIALAGIEVGGPVAG